MNTGGPQIWHKSGQWHRDDPIVEEANTRLSGLKPNFWLCACSDWITWVRMQRAVASHISLSFQGFSNSTNLYCISDRVLGLGAQGWLQRQTPPLMGFWPPGVTYSILCPRKPSTTEKVTHSLFSEYCHSQPSSSTCLFPSCICVSNAHILWGPLWSLFHSTSASQGCLHITSELL